MGGRVAATSMVVVCAHPEYVHVLLKSSPWKIVLLLSEGVMLISVVEAACVCKCRREMKTCK